MIQPLGLGRVRTRVHTCRTCDAPEYADIRILADPRINADAQALLKAVLRLFQIVLVSAANGRGRRGACIRGLLPAREGIPAQGGMMKRCAFASRALFASVRAARSSAVSSRVSLSAPNFRFTPRR